MHACVFYVIFFTLFCFQLAAIFNVYIVTAELQTSCDLLDECQLPKYITHLVLCTHWTILMTVTDPTTHDHVLMQKAYNIVIILDICA